MRPRDCRATKKGRQWNFRNVFLDPDAALAVRLRESDSRSNPKVLPSESKKTFLFNDSPLMGPAAVPMVHCSVTRLNLNWFGFKLNVLISLYHTV